MNAKTVTISAPANSARGREHQRAVEHAERAGDGDRVRARHRHGAGARATGRRRGSCRPVRTLGRSSPWRSHDDGPPRPRYGRCPTCAAGLCTGRSRVWDPSGSVSYAHPSTGSVNGAHGSDRRYCCGTRPGAPRRAAVAQQPPAGRRVDGAEESGEGSHRLGAGGGSARQGAQRRAGRALRRRQDDPRRGAAGGDRHDRPGRHVTDGTTVSDNDPAAIRQQRSVSLSCAPARCTTASRSTSSTPPATPTSSVNCGPACARPTPPCSWSRRSTGWTRPPPRCGRSAPRSACRAPSR